MRCQPESLIGPPGRRGPVPGSTGSHGRNGQCRSRCSCPTRATRTRKPPVESQLANCHSPCDLKNLLPSEALQAGRAEPTSRTSGPEVVYTYILSRNLFTFNDPDGQELCEYAVNSTTELKMQIFVKNLNMKCILI